MLDIKFQSRVDPSRTRARIEAVKYLENLSFCASVYEKHTWTESQPCQDCKSASCVRGTPPSAEVVMSFLQRGSGGGEDAQ